MMMTRNLTLALLVLVAGLAAPACADDVRNDTVSGLVIAAYFGGSDFSGRDASTEAPQDNGASSLITAAPTDDTKTVDRLITAASTGDMGSIEQILAAEPALVNSRDRLKNTPLHYAALNGHPETCRLLVSLGADVNARGQLGAAPLHCAARQGHKDTARALIESGADINAMCDLGHTPLHLAAENGHEGLVTFLLLRRADPNAIAGPGARSVLSVAVESLAGSPEAFRGAAATAPLSGRTGYRDIIDVLLEAGADPDVGLSSLAIAVRFRQRDIAERLLKEGAAPSVPERYGWTALHWAAANGDMSFLLKACLDKGADVDILDDAANTPLHWAAAADKAHAVDVLLYAGADIEAANVNGRTPLHLAAETVSTAAARVLLERGANVNALDTWSSTPLHRVFTHGDTPPDEQKFKFVAHRAEFFSPPMLENPLVTPDTRAEVVKLLIDAGAAPAAKDRGGMTPADLARARGIEYPLSSPTPQK